MTPTTSFIIFLFLASVAWARGNAFIHDAYLLFESAKVSKVLTDYEKVNIDWNRYLAHIFWWIAMAFLAVVFTVAFYYLAEDGLAVRHAFGAALYSIGCFWGVFGFVTKWMLNGTPFYLGDNWWDDRFKFKGGMVLMYGIQAAFLFGGIWLLN